MKNRYIIIILSLLSTLCLLSFADDDSRYVTEKLHEYDIIAGDQNGQFRLDKILNREEAVTILCRINQLNKSINGEQLQPFDDVPSHHWAYKNINYARSQGFIKGSDNNIFGLNQPVTLKQFCALMLRNINYAEFSDYEYSVDTALRLNLLNGISSYDQDESLSRSNAFIILYNTLRTVPFGETQPLIYKLNIIDDTMPLPQPITRAPIFTNYHPITTTSGSSISINMVGDVCFGTNFGVWDDYMDIYKNHGAGYFMGDALEIFKHDDLTLANLENVFTDKNDSPYKKIYTYRSPSLYVNILTEIEIDAYTLINNHMHDFDQTAFDETLNYLDKLSIGAFGYAKACSTDTQEVGNINMDKTLIFEKNGIRVGMLGYLGFYDAYVPEWKIQQDVTQLKKENVDYIISYVHWGGQNTRAINSQQINVAHTLIDNGVDLVVGSHPHVLQHYERYKNKRIYYSLGDFFAVWSNKLDKDTIILNLKLNKFKNNIITEEFTHIPVSHINGNEYNQVRILKDQHRINEVLDVLSGQ